MLQIPLKKIEYLCVIIANMGLVGFSFRAVSGEGAEMPNFSADIPTPSPDLLTIPLLPILFFLTEGWRLIGSF